MADSLHADFQRARRRALVWAGLVLLGVTVIGLAVSRWHTQSFQPITDPVAQAVIADDLNLFNIVEVLSGLFLVGLTYLVINRDTRLNYTVAVRTQELVNANALLARLAAIVESTDDAVIGKTLTGQIVSWNAGAEQLYGYTAAEMIGQPIACLVPPDRSDDLPLLLTRIGRGEHIRHFETMRRTKDGRSVAVSLTLSPIADATGHIIGASTIARDITERHQMEHALRDLNATLEQRVADRTAELQAANVQLTELDHLKDDFLSRISHELRTPLTNVKIYIELLEIGKPEKRDKYLQTLKREADKLHALIEEVLMFSQLNLNTVPAMLGALDLNHLIAGRLTTWQQLSAGHDLQVQLNLAQGLPSVHTDGELFMRALTRLIVNAINYTPTGSVTVSTALRDEDGGRWVTISVTDTGPGITPEDLPHIFDRFYRGRAAADYKTPGTGIGLSISREIAERLGGRLTVETQVGVGSTFTLWLPVETSDTV